MTLLRTGQVGKLTHRAIPSGDNIGFCPRFDYQRSSSIDPRSSQNHRLPTNWIHALVFYTPQRTCPESRADNQGVDWPRVGFTSCKRLYATLQDLCDVLNGSTNNATAATQKPCKKVSKICWRIDVKSGKRDGGNSLRYRCICRSFQASKLHRDE